MLTPYLFYGSTVGTIPIHILWIYLVSDVIPALAPSFQPAAPDILRRPPRRAGVLSNPWLLGSVLLTYIPVQQTVFHTQGLGWMEILVVSAGAAVTFVVMELVKFTATLFSRDKSSRTPAFRDVRY